MSLRHWLVLPPLALVTILACDREQVVVQQPKVLINECPHGWDSGTVNFGNLPVVGRIKGIPEFHDCQRFVNSSGAYMRFFAIFAAESLRQRYDSIADTSGAERNNPAWALGVIWSEADSYDPLHLKPEFNCLFVYRLDPQGVRLGAKVLPVGNDPSKCVQKTDPASLDAAVLSVVRGPEAPQAKDIPQVARWEWDDSSKVQYISIACGNAVCQVGPTDFKSSRPMAVSRIAAVEDARLWTDEQDLANAMNIPDPFPSGVRGVTEPHPNLGTLTEGDLDGIWQPAAKIRFSANYPALAEKWGIPADVSSGPYVVSFCMAKSRECPLEGEPVQSPSCMTTADPVAWWAKIDYPGGTAYRCIKRVDHTQELAGTGLTIPATARWHWVADDETLWARCLQGCCEVR